MRYHHLLKILGVAIVSMGIGILLGSIFPSWVLVFLLSLAIIFVGVLLCS